jgi:glycosyltransferase involved in cell wall biosynthesis
MGGQINKIVMITTIWLDSLSSDNNYSGGNIWARKSYSNYVEKYKRAKRINRHNNTKQRMKIKSSVKNTKHEAWTVFFMFGLFMSSTIRNFQLLFKIKDNLIIISCSDFPHDVIPAILLKVIRPTKTKWIQVIHHEVELSIRTLKLNSLIYFWWQRILRIMLYFFSDNIWAHSKFSIKMNSNRIKKKLIIGISGQQGNEYNCKRIRKSLHTELKILFIGRATKNKGFYDLIKIIKLLGVSYSIQLNLIVHDTELAIRIMRKKNINIHSTNILSNLSNEDMCKQIIQCDLFIQPSFDEGWNYSLREVINLKIPTFVYNLDIYNELNLPKLYVSKKGDWTSIVKKVDKFLKLSKVSKNRIVEQAFKSLEGHDWEQAYAIQARSIHKLMGEFNEKH